MSIRKIFLNVILILGFLMFPQIGLAFVSSDVVNEQAPEAYFYPLEFDKLIMDLTIPSGIAGEQDTLKALTLKNQGSARDLSDIEKIKIWKDEGKQGFQGMGIDKELGTFTFYSPNYSWYVKDLNEPVPPEGLRLFISTEIRRQATSNRTFQFKIPLFFDKNQNATFDLGDLGIFLESGNNGPVDKEIINTPRQTIRSFLIDNLAPKTVIVDPKDGAVVTTTSYKILGMARDQGGSSPRWVKIGINNTWYDVVATGQNFATWEYEWKNIEEGEYTLQTKSADWLGNNEIPKEEIVITVSTKALEEPVEEEKEKEIEEEISVPESVPEIKEEIAEKEKPVKEMTIEDAKVKITEIKKQIEDLKKRLVQLLKQKIIEIQEEIAELKTKP